MMLCDYRWSITIRTTKKKIWQRYGNSKRIYAPESDSNVLNRPKPDSNAVYFASQYDFYTPTVTAIWICINMIPLKREDYGWLLIGVFNKNYVPKLDLNSEYFNQKETPIGFGIRKNNRFLLGMKKNQVLAWFWTCIT